MTMSTTRHQQMSLIKSGTSTTSQGRGDLCCRWVIIELWQGRLLQFAKAQLEATSVWQWWWWQQQGVATSPHTKYISIRHKAMKAANTGKETRGGDDQWSVDERWWGWLFPQAGDGSGKITNKKAEMMKLWQWLRWQRSLIATGQEKVAGKLLWNQWHNPSRRGGLPLKFQRCHQWNVFNDSRHVTCGSDSK